MMICICVYLTVMLQNVINSVHDWCLQRGETPLMIAVQECEEAAVTALLANKANVEAKDEVSNLRDAFSTCCWNGYFCAKNVC